MGKKIKTICWLLLAGAALGFLVWQTPKEEFKRALTDIDWGWSIAGVVLYLISQTVLASRWVLLLRVHRVHISLFQAIKLTYLGLFYNNLMPGAVGGDLLRAWYVTQHSERHLRLEAAVTVFVDRLVGLIGMVIVGALASLFLRVDEGSGIRQIRWLIWGIFGALVLVSVLFLSRHVRRGLMLSRLLEKLPFARQLQKVDQAIRIYRNHVGTMVMAVLLTAVIQGLSIVAIWMLTQALHLEKVEFLQCLIIMPIIWVISAAIPVPGGLGVIENLVTYLFCLVIDPAAPKSAAGSAAALALMIRLLICLCSLPGALVPIFGGHLPKAKKMQEELEAES